MEQMDTGLFRSEEKAVFALRDLYRRYGYLPFRMSKFEEYELYIRNKDFLVSDRIITFNDTDGKLLALKPDVTLSIIKSGEDQKGCKQKVYYNENVYRVSGSTCQYREIMQAGLECIGDMDLYDIYEVISLAAESLFLLSESFVLDISHLGLLSAVLESICPEKEFVRKAAGFISEKNGHDLKDLCVRFGIPESRGELLSVFVTAYGGRNRVIGSLEELTDRLCGGEEGGALYARLREQLEEIKLLSRMLDKLPLGDRIRFDFSVVNDMNYYNGFVFKGFIDGVCDGILTGGQYDRMMARMKRTSKAAGFAVYLDLLEQLPGGRTEYDVDVLLIYGEDTDRRTVAETVGRLIEEGKTVSAQKGIPEKLRYRELLELGKEGAVC